MKRPPAPVPTPEQLAALRTRAIQRGGVDYNVDTRIERWPLAVAEVVAIYAEAADAEDVAAADYAFAGLIPGYPAPGWGDAWVAAHFRDRETLRAEARRHRYPGGWGAP